METVQSPYEGLQVKLVYVQTWETQKWSIHQMEIKSKIL